MIVAIANVLHAAPFVLVHGSVRELLAEQRPIGGRGGGDERPAKAGPQGVVLAQRQGGESLAAQSRQLALVNDLEHSAKERPAFAVGPAVLAGTRTPFRPPAVVGLSC